jgi:hypothetical protein
LKLNIGGRQLDGENQWQTIPKRSDSKASATDDVFRLSFENTELTVNCYYNELLSTFTGFFVFCILACFEGIPGFCLIV